MDGIQLTGKLDNNGKFPSPVTVRPATYNFRESWELSGSFKGQIKDGHLYIKYMDSFTTISGKTDTGDLVFDFSGNTEEVRND